ncbi:MAG: DUF302 domain-containing protein [Proteobacteria bacterium]|nr:DUF302 domain-containing protein [Pseudomonadota bacterium]
MIAPAGMRVVRSAFGPRQTADRFADAVVQRGMTVFARIDHAAGAEAAGLPLRPTELLVFGNARGGTPLMQAAQTLGIDLPLKALVWQDADGTTWLGYNDPEWFAARHGVGPDAAAALQATRDALAATVREAMGGDAGS